jgi:hypothetical protein
VRAPPRVGRRRTAVYLVAACGYALASLWTLGESLGVDGGASSPVPRLSSF